jgi:corrinoid protein of di/trimethylamine methyltransferase
MSGLADGSPAGVLREWRGFDLRPRHAKMARTLRLADLNTPEDLPVQVNTPCYFAFGSRNVPEDYFSNPASMVAYQADGYERHLRAVQDDFIPYFMPWFGTGVLASAFGCPIGLAPGPGNDPAVTGPCVTSPAQAARLKLPDPHRDGWMPRVLDTIDYALSESDLPPGLTDMQGPLDTLGLMCGQAQLYEWMYREPKMVHELFDLVTTAFIEWAKVQKQHIGEPLDRSNGLQGVVWPPGVGIWESDDDLVLLDAGLYREFVVPCVVRICAAFGGGSVHYCGTGGHQIENLLQIDGMRVVCNSPLGDFAAFARLKRRLGSRVVLQIQDAAPRDIEDYYPRLFAGLTDLRGIVLAPLVMDGLAMDIEGGYAEIDWEPFDAANRIVAVTRECVHRHLAGEPIVDRPTARVSFPVAAPAPAEKAISEPALTSEQAQALSAVQQHLIAFDGPRLAVAVGVALKAGLAPFAIVTHGLAEGMAEVGRRYEAGEFFLPQLVMAGATMRAGMEMLAPLLQGGAAGASKGTVVIGTVQGDMHDIGKNIVRTLLEAAGFAVHDIGVDRSAAHFVEQAHARGADIVALSALLTTTMQHMASVIDALREAGLRPPVRVMVGGAPISQEFADRIGADGYAPDAVKAVREAERLMTLNRE